MTIILDLRLRCWIERRKCGRLPQENARNTKGDVSASAFLAFFCGHFVCGLFIRTFIAVR